MFLETSRKSVGSGEEEVCEVAVQWAKQRSGWGCGKRREKVKSRGKIQENFEITWAEQLRGNPSSQEHWRRRKRYV